MSSKVRDIVIGAAWTVALRHVFLFVYTLSNQTGWPKTWWEPILSGLLAGAFAFSLRPANLGVRLAVRFFAGAFVALAIFALRAQGVYREFGTDCWTHTVKLPLNMLRLTATLFYGSAQLPELGASLRHWHLAD